MSILDLLLCVATAAVVQKSLSFYIPNIFAWIFEAQSSKVFQALTIIGFDETGSELKDKYVPGNGRDLHFEVFSTFYPIVHCSASVLLSWRGDKVVMA